MRSEVLHSTGGQLHSALQRMQAPSTVDSDATVVTQLQPPTSLDRPDSTSDSIVLGLVSDTHGCVDPLLLDEFRAARVAVILHAASSTSPTWAATAAQKVCAAALTWQAAACAVAGTSLGCWQAQRERPQGRLCDWCCPLPTR
jgi:hypothetical protein